MRRLTTAESFRGPCEPKLRIGDVVMINSGGPESIVVDLEGNRVTVAWRDKCGDVHEMTLPEPCFPRVKLGHFLLQLLYIQPTAAMAPHTFNGNHYDRTYPTRRRACRHFSVPNLRKHQTACMPRPDARQAPDGECPATPSVAETIQRRPGGLQRLA